MKLIWGLINIILLFSTYISYTDRSTEKKLQSAREVVYTMAEDQLQSLLFRAYADRMANMRPDLIKIIKTTLKKWEHSYELDYLTSELHRYIHPCYDTYDFTILKYKREEIANQFLGIEKNDNEFDKLKKIVPFIKKLLIKSCGRPNPFSLQLIHSDTLTLKSNQTHSFDYKIISNDFDSRTYINQKASETVEIKVGKYTKEIEPYVIEVQRTNELTGKPVIFKKTIYIKHMR